MLGRGLTSASTHGIKLKLLSAAGKFIIRQNPRSLLLFRNSDKLYWRSSLTPPSITHTSLNTSSTPKSGDNVCSNYNTLKTSSLTMNVIKYACYPISISKFTKRKLYKILKLVLVLSSLKTSMYILYIYRQRKIARSCLTKNKFLIQRTEKTQSFSGKV